MKQPSHREPIHGEGRQVPGDGPSRPPRSDGTDDGDRPTNFTPMVEIMGRLLLVHDLLVRALRHAASLPAEERLIQQIRSRLTARERARRQLAEALEERERPTPTTPPTEWTRGERELAPEVKRYLQYARFDHLAEAAEGLRDLLGTDGAPTDRRSPDYLRDLIAAIGTVEARLLDSADGLSKQVTEGSAEELVSAIHDVEHALARREAWNEQAAQTL